MLFRNTGRPPPTFASLPNTASHQLEKLSQHPQNNNKNIHALFQKEIVSIPHVMSYWNQFVNDIDWKKVPGCELGEGSVV